MEFFKFVYGELESKKKDINTGFSAA